MKAEITCDGYIKIQAETNAEKFALVHLVPPHYCDKCGMGKIPLIICTDPQPTADEVKG